MSRYNMEISDVNVIHTRKATVAEIVVDIWDRERNNWNGSVFTKTFKGSTVRAFCDPDDELAATELALSRAFEAASKHLNTIALRRIDKRCKTNKVWVNQKHKPNYSTTTATSDWNTTSENAGYINMTYSSYPMNLDKIKVKKKGKKK